jgi:hypothetical protein
MMAWSDPDQGEKKKKATYFAYGIDFVKISARCIGEGKTHHGKPPPCHPCPSPEASTLVLGMMLIN